MRKFFLLIVLIVCLLSIYSCNNDDLTPYEIIIGTWVGTEFPNQDSIIFYENDLVKVIGRGGSGDLQNFLIDNQTITISSQTGSSHHDYILLNNEKIYIKNVMATVDIDDDGGLEYQKIK